MESNDMNLDSISTWTIETETCATEASKPYHASWYLSNLMQYELVGGWPTPLKNMTSSVGMMNFPTEWKQKNVPNHQPVI